MRPLRADWWRAYIGGPYLWRGCEPVTGFDCWGLYRWALAHDFERPVNDFGWIYPAEDDTALAKARAFATGVVKGWRPVAWEEGAAALFEVNDIPVHIGICTRTRGVILHAHEDVGVETLDINQSVKWKGRFVGCFLPG